MHACKYFVNKGLNKWSGKRTGRQGMKWGRDYIGNPRWFGLNKLCEYEMIWTKIHAVGMVYFLMHFYLKEK